ncbi:sodium/hydrogen exchanger [Terfezia boudieri ATCC MYA-4762]|uniref:Sodium/hydrogen exchanger n=1 Tax=Terfezia boudieri ATCC MYA-4762 TaxID=1051890 RepID=A0A3N4M0F9_9PEZI|nr:sodium/hydrogen exchanger [Terfezia boudieri ATCC MYA-4762]
MLSFATDLLSGLLKPSNPEKEIFSSWALFILVALLIAALFTSYYLQLKKIQAVHETVISIFAGMFVGLVIRATGLKYIQDLMKFDYQFFFNLLLPPIILNSGYELHQANFFRNIGTILTFAFAGTFISAIVVGVLLFLWSLLHLDGLSISFVEAICVGATLSATDPVTILAIFNTYKVDPKLYTVIFGESILNDAVAIVMFETAQQFHGHAHVGSLFKGIGIFFIVFMASLLIGVFVGIATALLLKHTYIRRFPRIESCIVLLVAYASYFFSNGCRMSGIVSLLFCGITLKHYAYYNMSRRTQLTTKYIFQVLAQLSENFIFIYLGLSLFTDDELRFKPLFIIMTTVAICIARWVAVFPLSKLINATIAFRARRRGRAVTEELPHAYQAMLFWAGLRGAVGVALAASMTGKNAPALRMTILVVVVLTVIVFGGTTARMLEILGIRTGVVEEIDSDDEFDIEAPTPYRKRPGYVDGSMQLGSVGASGTVYSTRSTLTPIDRPESRTSRRSSPLTGSLQRSTSFPTPSSSQDLTVPSEYDSDSELPPMAPIPRAKSLDRSRSESSEGGDVGVGSSTFGASLSAGRLLSSTTDDHAEWFRQLDEGYIKPRLLLNSKGHGNGGGPA